MASFESPGRYKMVSWSSFMREMYSSREVSFSGSFVEWNLRSFASLFLLLASSITPNLMFLPKFAQNLAYLSSFSPSSSSFSATWSASSSDSSTSSSSSSPYPYSSSSSSSSLSSARARIISIAFLTSFLLMTFIIFICYNCSLLTLRGKSSESTTPLMKLR